MDDVEIVFENTSNKIEVTKCYSIKGVGLIEHKGTCFEMVSARLVFRDGDCTELLVTGRVVRWDGEATNRLLALPHLFTTNQVNWPKWLFTLWRLAHSELQKTAVYA